MSGKIHQSWFVVATCVGIVVGTILALVFRVSFFSSPLWVVVSLAIIVVVYFVPRAFLIILAVVAGMLLAFYKSSAELIGEDYVRQFYGQTVVVGGTIEGDPDADDGKTKFKLTNLKFGDAAENEARGNLYISLSAQNAELKRGDHVVLEGELMEGFGTYAGFMSRPRIVQWARADPPDLVLTVRDWFANRIQLQTPSPEAELGLSYLLGMKTGLPDDLNENLRTVGLVHIVVASGAHLAILVEIARKLFGKMSRVTGMIFSILFIIFFMAMVGWTPSIMRAGVMSILTLVAWFVGRKIAAWRIILLVASLTLLVNPMFIINLGWLLSFASFAGIMILGPRLTKFFYGEKEPKFIASTIITTISATLMTLPITLYYFGTMSLISVLANLLILPTLSYAMGLVFLTGMMADLPFVQTAVAFLSTKLLDFHIGVVEFFGQMKSFMVEIEVEQVWTLALYGVILLPFAVGFGLEWLNKLRSAKQKVKTEIGGSRA